MLHVLPQSAVFACCSVSHGALYPALYLAYFHVLCLDTGIMQGFIAPWPL